VVVASAHRGAAFEACRWLIDTLKKTVPIWKKEQFVDGASWADGEPFPEEQRVGELASQRTDGLPKHADGLGEEGGRPPDEAHISESRYGAPDSVVGGRPGAAK
jgi:ribosomal protein S18 acetylase RimI-like enzyme